jgi:hypothetical protein
MRTGPDNAASRRMASDSGPALGAAFEEPTGVAVDRKGDVYIAVQGCNIVEKVTVGAPATPTVSRRCSRATALRVARRFRLAAGPDRVAKVLCGAFVGPRSRAMVVAITPGTCGINGWAVFRYKGGAWRLVGSRHVGWVNALAAVGSVIRETAPVPTGKFQCPTSGKARSRIWHWNGTRLVAGPWKRVTPPK